MVKDWNSLPREVLELPSLEVFKNPCSFSCGTKGRGLMVDLMVSGLMARLDLRDLFQP